MTNETGKACRQNGLQQKGCVEVGANALGDLLPRDRFEEPPEVQIIKTFMKENYQQTVGVSVQPGQIIIHVQGAALAGTLRMRLHELKELCQTDKKLIIRM